MKNTGASKVLYMIVNAGFADEIIEIARSAGAAGATIINARGEGVTHKSFMGITVDTEKEIILTVAKDEVAERIMSAIKEKAGFSTPANSICFMLPVDKMTEINTVNKFEAVGREKSE